MHRILNKTMIKCILVNKYWRHLVPTTGSIIYFFISTKVAMKSYSKLCKSQYIYEHIVRRKKTNSNSQQKTLPKFGQCLFCLFTQSKSISAILYFCNSTENPNLLFVVSVCPLTQSKRDQSVSFCPKFQF